MSASRVEVDDGVSFGSEHVQCLVENRRLKAEIERGNAEIRRLTAENELPLRERERQMMAEIRRLTAENIVFLRERLRERERERRREAESVWEGSAPGGPTDVPVDVPAISAGFDDGGLETPHAGNLPEIAHDAMDDEDAGGKERSQVRLLAETRRLTADNERLQESLLQAGPRTHDSAGVEVLESRRAELPAHIRWLTAELERVHAQLEAERRVNNTVVDIPSTLSSAPSTVAMLGEEAPNVAGYTSTPVLPFVDERTVRAPLQDLLTSADAQDASAQIGAAGIAADTSGVDGGISSSKIRDAKIARLVAVLEHLEARLDAELRAVDCLDESCNTTAALVSSHDFLNTRLGLADFAHDDAWRTEMVNEMRKGGQSYSEEEARQLAEATTSQRALARLCR
jgi:hypothetical protein